MDGEGGGGVDHTVSVGRGSGVRVGIRAEQIAQSSSLPGLDKVTL